MIENPFEKRKKKKLNMFSGDTSDSLKNGSLTNRVPRKFDTSPRKVSNTSSLGSEEEMLKALSMLSISGGSGGQEPPFSSQGFNPSFSKEFEGKWGVPFGNQPTGNPFNLTTPGMLEGVVKNREMPYDNQPRVRFPDEIKMAQELASTPAPQVPEQAVPAQSQGNGSSDRINQLIALGQAMGGNADIDQMIVGAILEEMMSGRESRTDELAQAYQLTQDPLIGKEFATGLYGELGIDPIKAQKEQMLMEKFLEEFQESPETADIFEAVRRNPGLVEQYFNLTEQEGKGFLGLNNTENKRLERMRRLMGVE